MTAHRKLTCVIVDDETLGRNAIRQVLAQDPDVNIVGEATNAETAYDLIESTHPDLLFLDIEMPEMSGLELLQLLRSEGVRMPTVVFITAWDQYAIRAFEAQAVDYLLKPFDDQRFRRACEVAKMRARADHAVHAARLDAVLSGMQTGRIAIRKKGRISFIDIDVIDWVEADANYLHIHVGSETHVTRETMHSFETRLQGHRFARVHRSAIVNIARIREVEPWYTGEHVLKLDNGRELTLTRTYRDKFFATMNSVTR
jgi:two-component system, LytTR family, response regulator